LELDPARVARVRPHHAVVDIGSNSVRLVVYDELGRAPFPRFNEKSLCRLGEGLEQTGRLSATSFACTLDACRRFRAICDAGGARRRARDRGRAQRQQSDLHSRGYGPSENGSR
jgi:exopolyphosphatase/guanosine-5'-triphosphate,3'-diphosphate pyrophosphatase